MHRLFWKLFLTFWLALLLFAGGVVIAASWYLDQARFRPDGWRPEDGYSALRQSAQNAADQGLAGLVRWSREFDDNHLVPLLVMNQEGKDILGREVTPTVNARFSRYQKPTDDPALRERRTPITAAQQPYWLVPDFQGVTLSRLVSRPGVVAVQLIVATLVGGGVCFLLAWHLLGPIERLRRAAQLYGSGDLAHRVAPTMGKRKDEFVDLAKAMDGMAEKIGELLASHKILLRDVSHELRSPLARAHAAASLAREKTAGEADDELSRIENELERLDTLIGQILTYSRLETGIKTIQHEEIQLDQLVQAVAEDAAIEAAAKPCQLRCAALPNAPAQGDPALLYSAINNIVSNAIRHTPPGGEVELSLNGDDGGWRISISDNGPGIPEEALESIFEPFVRLDPSRTAVSGGAGLGLAIARSAIAHHGGKVAARNRAAGGVEFCIHIPLTPITSAGSAS